MKGNRYYANLDFSKPIGTHRWVDNIKSRRQLAKVALVAMARIQQAEQGTITCPYELASSSMKDGRTLIQTIILIPQPVKNYRQVLDFMKLFYSDGEKMKRLISIGRIKEILK